MGEEDDDDIVVELVDMSGILNGPPEAGEGGVDDAGQQGRCQPGAFPVRPRAWGGCEGGLAGLLCCGQAVLRMLPTSRSSGGSRAHDRARTPQHARHSMCACDNTARTCCCIPRTSVCGSQAARFTLPVTRHTVRRPSPVWSSLTAA